MSAERIPSDAETRNVFHFYTTRDHRGVNAFRVGINQRVIRVWKASNTHDGYEDPVVTYHQFQKVWIGGERGTHALATHDGNHAETQHQSVVGAGILVALDNINYVHIGATIDLFFPSFNIMSYEAPLDASGICRPFARDRRGLFYLFLGPGMVQVNHSAEIQKLFTAHMQGSEKHTVWNPHAYLAGKRDMRAFAQVKQFFVKGVEMNQLRFDPFLCSKNEGEERFRGMQVVTGRNPQRVDFTFSQLLALTQRFAASEGISARNSVPIHDRVYCGPDPFLSSDVDEVVVHPKRNTAGAINHLRALAKKVRDRKDDIKNQQEPLPPDVSVERKEVTGEVAVVDDYPSPPTDDDWNLDTFDYCFAPAVACVTAAAVTEVTLAAPAAPVPASSTIEPSLYQQPRKTSNGSDDDDGEEYAGDGDNGEEASSGSDTDPSNVELSKSQTGRKVANRKALSPATTQSASENDTSD